MDKYILDYTVIFTDKPQENHTMKINNCISDLHAKVRLEEHLKKKHSNFKQLIVTKCRRDWGTNPFDFKGSNDIFSQFGDIFGKK